MKNFPIILSISLISVTLINAESEDGIKGIIEKIGNWPMIYPKDYTHFRWDVVDNEYSKLTGESAFFNTSITPDEEHNSQPLITITSLSPRYGTPASDKNSLRLVLDRVYSQKHIPDTIDKDLEDVAQFRNTLWRISKASASPHRLITTIAQFQRDIDPRSIFENAKVNWLEKIRSVQKSPEGPTGSAIQNTTSIKVQMPYFGKLVTLLGKTPINVILNHIHLYFAELRYHQYGL